MAPEELASAVRRRPFVPFRLTLTEGGSYEVRHPELCMPSRRSALIGLNPSNETDLLFDRSVTIDLLQIVNLEPLDAPTAKTNGTG